jgi:hypothetical protein
MKLVGKALRSRWTLPENLPAHLVVRLGRLATDKGGANRDALATIKLLVEIERMGLAAIDTEIKARTHGNIQVQLEEIRDLLEQSGKAEGRKKGW